MIEETNRNVQLTMATQSLQGRLTAIERSANALRQILRQKFGDQGVVHMMEALEKLGAGSNALLEVPASSTAEVVSADVLDRTPYSYEAKHPDSPPGAGGATPSPSSALASSYYLQPHSGVSEASSLPVQQRPQRHGAPPPTGGYAAAGVGAESDNPYARAIEGAMYSKK